MLMIRLARFGARKQPFYRVVLPGQPPQDKCPHTVKTDDHGHFAIQGLQPECYRITVEMQSTPTPDDNLPHSDVCFGDSQHLTGYSVRLTPSSSAPGGAIPVFPPHAAGSIAGQVVSGVDGSPVAYQPVILDLPGSPPVIADDHGRFVFQNVAPGRHGLILGEPTPTALSSILDFPMPESTSVTVGEGQRISALVLKRYPRGAISGKVTSDSGEPCAGTQVEGFRFRKFFEQLRPGPSFTTSTDGAGNYRAGDLLPGDYYVWAGRPDPPRGSVRTPINLSGNGSSFLYLPAPVVESLPPNPPTEGATTYVPAWYSNGSQPVAVQVIGAEAGRVDIILRKSKVTQISGRIVDPAGAPAGTYNLTLRPEGSRTLGWSLGNAVVTKDGSFAIFDVPPGSYRLLACSTTGPGRRRWAGQTVEVKESPVDQIRLELSAGRTIKGSFRIENAAAVIKSGYVRLTPLETSDLASRSTNAAADGTFVFRTSGPADLFPLIYALEAQDLPPEYYVKSVRYGGREVTTQKADLTGDGELEIVLGSAAATVEGKVTDADGQPSGDAALALVRAGDSWPLRTGIADAHGYFYFGNLPPGSYRVFAWNSALPKAEAGGELASGGKMVQAVANERASITVRTNP